MTWTKKGYFEALLCLTLLVVQAFEAFTKRDDFPFTQWAMYKGFPPHAPFIIIEVVTNHSYEPEEHIIREPWKLNTSLFPALGLGNPGDYLDKDIEYYLALVKERSENHRDEIHSIVQRQFLKPHFKENVKVKFLAWRHLRYDNKDTPDISYTFYDGSLSP